VLAYLVHRLKGRPLLVVIDGAKALASAVRQVFGELALIQRCTLHKRRNVADRDQHAGQQEGDPHRADDRLRVGALVPAGRLRRA
jgi:transposase-like protein